MKRDCVYIFLITFAAYLVTLSPTIYWRDSGELIATAFELGIAHPSGSPLYSSVANFFTYLPFGGVAFRVNLFSSFFCSLVAVLTFITTLYLLRLFPVIIPFGAISRFIAFYAAICFAFSRSFWDLSTTAEVYSFQNFFIILILCLLVLLYEHAGNPQGSRLLPESLVYLIGFLFGLSSGAHMIMLLYFPAIVISIALLWGGFFREPKVLGLFLFFVILGGSIYIYLPVRSSANPFWDWGNPETFENFWSHVTDKKDEGYHFGFSLSTLFVVLKKQLGFYWNDFSLIGICLGISGILYTISRKWRVFILLAGMVFAQWIFFIRYWGWSSQYVPSFMVFSIFMGVGLKCLLDWLYALMKRLQSVERFGSVASMLLIAGVAQVASAAYLNGSEVDKSSYWSPREFSAYLLDDMDDGGIALSQFAFFGTSYLSFVEGARPTVTLMYAGDLFRPDTFNPLTAARFPLLVIPKVPGRSSGEVGSELFLRNPGRKFYWEPSSQLYKTVMDNLIPNGYFYVLDKDARHFTKEELKNHRSKIAYILDRGYAGGDSFFKDENESEMMFQVISGLAGYFIEKGEPVVAVSHLRAAEELLPAHVGYDHGELVNMIGAAYASMGALDIAEGFFIRAVTINPLSKVAWSNLAVIYLDKGELQKVADTYKSALNLYPNDPEMIRGLADVMALLDNSG